MAWYCAACKSTDLMVSDHTTGLLPWRWTVESTDMWYPVTQQATGLHWFCTVHAGVLELGTKQRSLLFLRD